MNNSDKLERETRVEVIIRKRLLHKTAKILIKVPKKCCFSHVWRD